MFGGRKLNRIQTKEASSIARLIVSLAPPQPSPAELKAQEDEAALTVQKIIVGGILLYLSPFAIDFVKKLV
ncbi:mitochondrial import receptor subunit OR translocase-domain-containing protein [Xylogone sp. PMI_703]|nr:mitochondrial import receptor subunit OR translocase-domain-containing protein [Xylogone sp. PMI_703]